MINLTCSTSHVPVGARQKKKRHQIIWYNWRLVFFFNEMTNQNVRNKPDWMAMSHNVNATDLGIFLSSCMNLFGHQLVFASCSCTHSRDTDSWGSYLFRHLRVQQTSKQWFNYLKCLGTQINRQILNVFHHINHAGHIRVKQNVLCTIIFGLQGATFFLNFDPLCATCT